MSPFHGVGLGLRWDFLDEFLEDTELELPFIEVSPENYMRRGGYIPAAFERLGSRYPVSTHGLMMSLGGTNAFSDEYFAELRRFLEKVGARWHTDHLCWSGTPGTIFHELLPLPLNQEAVSHCVKRIKDAQSRLDVPLGVENVSWYAEMGKSEMKETDFINEILDQADCKLLLDVNNVYVNSQNHGFDPYEFLAKMPLERVVQMHVAGHSYWEDEGLIIDTHGNAVPDPVYELMAWVIERAGPLPVLLERDNNVPPYAELIAEVKQLQARYDKALQVYEERSA